MALLIVDGYNVIRMTAPYRELAERDDLDAARARLVADAAEFAGAECDVVIVFDGAGNVRSTGEPREMLGVRVIFSPYGTDADTVIEKLARQARERGESVEVVTSDAQTQWAVMGGPVVRRSSGEFALQLSDAREEWRTRTSAGSAKHTIEDLVPDEVRESLRRWALGGE